MRLGILNGELGIAVIEGIEDLGHIQIQLIKKQMPEGAGLRDLAFFYMSDRDWIVINKSHQLYEYYSQVVPAYLKLSADNRKKAHAEAPTNTTRLAFDILDEAIRQRLLIYGKADYLPGKEYITDIPQQDRLLDEGMVNCCDVATGRRVMCQ